MNEVQVGREKQMKKGNRREELGRGKMKERRRKEGKKEVRKE